MSEFTPLVRREEIDFLLFDCLGHAGHEARDVFEATLDVATRLATDVFVPLGPKADVIVPEAAGLEAAALAGASGLYACSDEAFASC